MGQFTALGLLVGIWYGRLNGRSVSDKSLRTQNNQKTERKHGGVARFLEPARGKQSEWPPIRGINNFGKTSFIH